MKKNPDDLQNKIIDVEETEDLNEQQPENIVPAELPPRQHPLRERQRPAYLTDYVQHDISP